MKKRNGRKIIACALAFVLMIGVLPTQAFAATDSELKEIPSVETAEQSVDNVEEVSDGNNGLDPVQNDSETDSENKSIGNFEFYIATSSQSVKLASIKDNGKNTIYIPVSLMSKTAILDFTIKSDSTEQFSVAYSEFDIDGNEKETLTLKESNAGTVSINGSYREQYSFFRYISANNLKWTKTIELSYDGESVEYTVVPFCDVTKLSVTETAGAKNTRPMQLLADGTYTTTVVANSSVKITAGGGIQNVDTTAIDGAGSSVTKTFSGDESLNIRISSKVEGVEAREYTLNVKCIEKDYFPTFVGGTKPSAAGIKLTVAQGTKDFYLDSSEYIDAESISADTVYEWTLLSTKAVVSTEATCLVNTDAVAGAVFYTCKVTNIVDGFSYSTSYRYNIKISAEALDAPKVSIAPKIITCDFGKEATPLKVELKDAALGVQFHYQWYSNTVNDNSNGQLLQGETKSSLIVPTNTVGTTWYYCVVYKVFDGKTSPTATTECAQVTVNPWKTDMNGDGSADSPYEIATVSDIEYIRDSVNSGLSFDGVFFKFVSDITLPNGWTPIGCTVDGTNKFDPRNPDEKDNLRAFSGTILGNGKLLTVPKGGKPLLAYVKNATVKDLNIYGEEINGYGLVDGLHGVGFTSEDTFAIIIENVTLKSGTKTLKSGLIGAEVDMDVNGFAGASAAFITTIRNCTIEKDVVVGYDGTQSEIGAFAGRFQGIIENCVSHATVKGVDYVGGIIGSRDNAMGQCTVSKCSFDGTVIASGKFAGGIAGTMYTGAAAPNGIKTTIEACVASGSINGNENVGGITGGDMKVNQAWNSYSITGNTFSGKVSGAKNVGGIIGYYRSLNKFDNIAGNAYLKGCGAEQGIGAVDYVDTSCETHETASGATYFDTSKSLPDIYGVTKENHNRTDDPLGKDASNLTMEVEDATTPICYKLDISGDYKTTYTIGEALDLSGMVCTAHWTMNKADTVVDTKDIEITGFDTNQRGEQTVTLAYGAAKVTITVTVLLPAGKDITVSFALLGDSAHGDSGDKHTLADNNLETWIDTTKVTVSNNATVLDVILAVVGDKFDIKNESGNYIQAITPKDGTELAEFTNGNLSGWMYTLNGVHPNLGVAQQYLNEGDVIVFHYTDDYPKEYEAEQNRTKTAEEVIAMIDAIGTVDLSKAGAISAARSAYDKLTDAEKALVTNYNVLVAAEAAYAKLVTEMGKKLDEIYKTTGDFMGTLGTPTVNSIGGEWMVIGLARSGHPVPAGYYDNVVEYVKAKADANERLHPAKVTDNARVILALTAIGKDVTNVGGHNLLKGLDNMDYIQTQGINGPIWALIALDSHNYPTSGDVTREKLIQVILDAQLSNGGWNLSGNDADPDMTAMAIQSLAPYYKENEAVKAAVDKALDVLSELQLATGGFDSWGTENSESCAQVIVALTALGIDPAKDSRFIKNGLTILDALASYYVDGGGFRHIASGDRDGMATEQGYYALAAYYRFINGQTRLYDMSDVTIKANEQPVQPTDPTTPGTPATGDNQPVMLWFGSVLISGAAILLLAQKKKKVR